MVGFFSHCRKITIHDTNPEIFSMFLEFLYSGHIQMDSLSTDQLTELLTLADRYEVLICYLDIFLKRKINFVMLNSHAHFKVQ